MLQENLPSNEPSPQDKSPDVVHNPLSVEVSSLSPLEKAILQATPEAEQAPSWFKQAFRKIADAWCDPKSFESEQMYEKLGVKLFKKYVPTGGDLAHRLVWKRFGIPNLVRFVLVADRE